jgi:Phenylpropionate dioxygenase and related ring-hydroxylating dioxygenases, large terminal subunit
MCNQTSFWDDAKGLLEEWYVACTSKELKKDQPFSATLYGKKLFCSDKKMEQPLHCSINVCIVVCLCLRVK